MLILIEGADEHDDLNLHCSDMPTCTFFQHTGSFILTVACFPVMQLHFYELFSVVDIAQRKTAEDECGYNTFDYKKVGRNNYNYYPRSGIIQYGRCTASKHYFCDSCKFLRCIKLLNPYTAEFLFSFQ